MSMVPHFSGPFGPPSMIHNEFPSPFQSFHDEAFRNFQAASPFHHNGNFFGSPHGGFPRMPPFPAFPDHHAAGPKVDWKETDAAYVIKVEQPAGMDKLELEIQNHSVMRIFGEMKKEKADRGSKESSFAMFEKKFKLPEDANVELIEVKTENGGVMVVTVPKMRRNNGHAQQQLHGAGDAKHIGISG